MSQNLTWTFLLSLKYGTKDCNMKSTGGRTEAYSGGGSIKILFLNKKYQFHTKISITSRSPALKVLSKCL